MKYDEAENYQNKINELEMVKKAKNLKKPEKEKKKELRILEREKNREIKRFEKQCQKEENEIIESIKNDEDA